LSRKRKRPWPRFLRLVRRRSFGQGFPIVFEAGIPLRRALTTKLFSCACRGTIDDIDMRRALFALGK